MMMSRNTNVALSFRQYQRMKPMSGTSTSASTSTRTSSSTDSTSTRRPAYRRSQSQPDISNVAAPEARRGGVGHVRVTSFRQFQRLHPLTDPRGDTNHKDDKDDKECKDLAGVTSHWDQHHQCTYFHNAATNKVAWNLAQVVEVIDMESKVGDGSSDRKCSGGMCEVKQVEAYWNLVNENARKKASTELKAQKQKVEQEQDQDQDAEETYDTQVEDSMATTHISEHISRHWDTQHECFYYHSALTGESGWELTDVAVAPSSSPTHPAHPNHAHHAEQKEEQQQEHKQQEHKQQEHKQQEEELGNSDEDEDMSPLQLYKQRTKAVTGTKAIGPRCMVKPLQLHLITALAAHRYQTGLATP